MTDAFSRIIWTEEADLNLFSCNEFIIKASEKKNNIITRKERNVGKIEYKLFKPIFKLQKIFFKRYRYYHCS
jgi:hypothetical protein